MPDNPWLAATGGTAGADYASRFAALEASGRDVHGEARLVGSLVPAISLILDAGCGTGRVAIRLAEFGHRTPSAWTSTPPCSTKPASPRPNYGG